MESERVPPSDEVARHEADPFLCREHGVVVPENVCPVCLRELRQCWAVNGGRRRGVAYHVAYWTFLGLLLALALGAARWALGV